MVIILGVPIFRIFTVDKIFVLSLFHSNIQLLYPTVVA